MQTILELSCTEAREFFLKQESYCSIELPQYFVFQKLLNELSKNKGINNIPFKQAGKFDDVNYTFFTNKDGKFAWRPLQLINPAIYVFLVHKITEENNWNLILERFKEFQKNSKIKCYSIPVISKIKNKSNKATVIMNWWHTIEQQSLEFALDYDCFLNTDIADCYGSIYTHTIAWALRSKNEAKKNREDDHIANTINKTIESMQYGQTNGIPQGSVLMDFIAEIVLGYADELLSNKIKEHNDGEEKKYKIENYQILRYRDDYRIFTMNEETAVKITKLLTEVLIDLNLKLNTQKTFISNNIIKDAIKPDKLYWNTSKQEEKTLQKHLLLIHSLAEKYPNSGSLRKALDSFHDIVYPYPLKLFKENDAKVLVSILVDIAYNNPTVYPVIVAILSKILSLETDKKIINDILAAIEKKFEKIPNIGHLQVWLQRLTLSIIPCKDYSEKLCKKIINENTTIWNIDWLNNNTIKNIFLQQSIVDRNYIQNMEQIMKPEEVQLLGY
jgi:hypothetical protein